jgi:hypothetical protein
MAGISPSDPNTTWKTIQPGKFSRSRATAKNSTAPLPSLDHLTFQDYQHVYEPSDDTYLLLDACSNEFGQGVEIVVTGRNVNVKCQFYSIACGSFRVLEIG